MMRRAIHGAVLTGILSKRQYTDARTIRKPNQYDQIAGGENEQYISNLLEQFKHDRALVDPSWIPILEALRAGDVEKPLVATFSRPIDSKSLSEKQRLDNMRLSWMIREYERSGHHIAAVNPLVGYATNNNSMDRSEMELSAFGFDKDDLDQVFNVTLGCTYESIVVSGGTAMTLAQLVEQLRKMYCGPIGFEFMASGFFHLRNWFRQEIINSLQPLKAEDRKLYFQDVVEACGFESYLRSKYPTQTRFGLDGGEATIPCLNAAITESSRLGVKSCVLGMAHRGRLNVLANVLNKSVHAILNEFEGKTAFEDAHRSGDVKYHVGYRCDVTLPNGNPIDLELLPNPSHLEAVNPLVLGKVCARQVNANDAERTQSMPILIHGDAAFTAQGSCYEAMGLSDLESFDVGGTLHIVINNQIGFTTEPRDQRVSAYCSDLAKVNHAPVMHVNGDDVDACVRAAQIAARFRQQFHRDIIIDIVCYRRYGNNETDIPDYTQPQAYQQIREHPRLIDIYSKQLQKDGVITPAYAATKNVEWGVVMRQAYDRMSSVQDFLQVKPVFDPESENRSPDVFTDVSEKPSVPPRVETGVSLKTLANVGRHLSTIPKEMKNPHPVVERTYAARLKGVLHGDGIEWCMGELLAIGTLALSGVGFRLSGEDVERGTFTQRHAAITDARTNLKYIPVKTISPNQALVTITNSSLSELAVCGFEMGYNMENPKNLTMWEAQFGDFANGAQIIFDQFLACCEEKWNEHSSLILSLPHGYSGAGPEHSSARIERFLQLCDEREWVPSNFRSLPKERLSELRIKRRNWQVAYPSTPANYFHLLRRQGLRDFAKPLVIFFSKARLRAPNLSHLEEMGPGTYFKAVIDTAARDDIVPRKVVFCSGQIESIVSLARENMQKKNPGVHDDVVLVKLEQLSPFPWEDVAEVVEKYVGRKPEVEIVWMQEEPKNMGMWTYMRPRFNSLFRKLNVKQRFLKFIGRPAAASPSTGYGSVHAEEERQIIKECFA